MTEHIRVGTELIEKIQDLIGDRLEGFVKVYFDKNNELDANWYLNVDDMDVIVEGENYTKTKERYIVTFDVRQKPFKQMDLVQPILVKVNLDEKKEDKIGTCILCDKDILYTDNAVVGKQSGDMTHSTCYTTWLKEKMRGKDT